MNGQKYKSRFQFLAILSFILFAMSLVPLTSVTNDVYGDETITSDEAHHILQVKRLQKQAKDYARRLHRHHEADELLRAIFNRDPFSSPLFRKIAFPRATAPASSQDRDKPASVSTTFIVTTTADNGDNINPTPGSLRKAIIDANNNPGLDNISFAISGTGVQTIIPQSPLPSITTSMIIDGTTQFGYADAPLIEINGISAGANENGLSLEGGGTTIKGLIINRFGGSGLFIPSNNNTIQGNYIGTNASGTVAAGNAQHGLIILLGASNNLVGGTIAGTRNVISGNAFIGVSLFGANANLVQGNYIGLDATGSTAIGNFDGISIDFGSSTNTIGGVSTDARNLISGNLAAGISLADEATRENQVLGNYIGTNLTGNTAVGNGSAGILITFGANSNLIGGTTNGARNVISGNNQYGLLMQDIGTTENAIQGNYIGTNASGNTPLGNQVGILIRLGTSNNTIGGTSSGARNVISGNTESGIFLQNSGTTGNQVLGNYIGTNSNGTAAIQNGGFAGIRIQGGASNNIIGGTSIGAGNVISGNNFSGIVFLDNGTNNNTVQGNYIGTNANGDAALGNSGFGIIILSGANNNQIGGTVAASRNIISGNQSAGVRIDSNGNSVRSNYIGTNPSGTSAIPNLSSGVIITGGASNNQIGGLTTNERNIISGNNGNGLDINSSGTMNNTVQDNYIGTSANGNTALSNGFDGVVIFAGASNNLIGGTMPEARNIISGNNGSGVHIFTSNTSNNTIQGNYIGTNASGNTRLGNGSVGVSLASATNNNLIGGTLPGARNIISGNNGAGIQIQDAGTSGNQILNNYIGTNAAGNASVFNDGFAGIYILNSAGNNIIGSTSTAARNLISGNRNYGIRVQSSNANSIQNNYIGTTADGNAALPNADGILIHAGASNNLIGGTVSEARNLISGNIFRGVVIQDAGTSGNFVQGNFIGTNASGNASLGNSFIGIVLTFGTTNNVIGGATVGAGNVIAFHSNQGILCEDVASTGNSIRGNAIHSNGQLGIDLNNDGVTANDAGDGDTGPNNLQNYPVIASALTNGSSITVQGSLNSTSQTGFAIDFFTNPAADPTNFGEGRTYLGSTSVTTDASGNAAFNITFNIGVPAGQFITATATRNVAPLDTSEFSLAVVASAANPCDNLTLQPNSASFNSAGGTNTFKIIDAANCNWTATTTDTWVSNIMPASGVGDANISYTVAANPSSNPRTGTINVNGRTFTITQAGNPTITDIPVVTISAYDNGILIEWQTGFEVNNLGFNLYRQDNTSRTLLTPQVLAGSALVAGQSVRLAAGQTYEWWDAARNNAAQYWLEDIDLNGVSTWHGPFFAQKVGGVPPAFSRAIALSETGNHQAPATRFVEPVATLQQNSFAAVTQVSLASRRALKIAIKNAGWYRLTSPELFAAGLDRDADPRLLQLFVDGAEIPVIVTGAEDGKFDADDMLEFFGVGLDMPATNSRLYWLTWAQQPGLRVQQAKTEGSLPAPQNFPATVESRGRSIYFSSLKNGERENFFSAVITAQPVEQSLIVQHLDQADRANVSLEITVQGVTSGVHRVKVSLNGSVIGFLSFSGITQTTASFSLSPSALLEGANQLRLMVEGGATDVNLLDTIRLTYPHTFTADDDSLLCTASPNMQLFIDGFTNESIRVFDISNRDAVKELPCRVTKGRQGFGVFVTPQSAQNSRLFAIAANRVKQAGAISLNREANWRNANNAADLLILAHRDFMQSAVRLKQHREKQGLSVAVVDIEDIYDEFSFGHKSVAAVQEFLRFATEKWSRKPHYLLLFGDASYDPKNYLGLGDSDFVPTKLLDTEFLETASDEALADFNNDSIAELAIGRLPVRTASEANKIVNKLIAYDGSRPSPEVLLVADENDEFDFERASSTLPRLLPATLQAQQINRGRLDFAVAKRHLLEALNRGQKLVNYDGHGNLRLWRGNLLTATDAASLTNRDRLSVFVLMTCLNGYFHDVLDSSLAESLLQADNGAIAVWASTGLTPPTEQAMVNQNLYKQLFTQNPSLRLGEAIRQTKFLTQDGDIRRTWVLLGDPTLQIR